MWDFQSERAFETLLLFICNVIDFEQLLYETQNKKKDTRSATANFGKEEVSKIRQVFARNTRSSYIVVFHLGQGRGSQELSQNRNCHV